MKKAEQADFPKFEAEMLKIWEKERTFEASLRLRQDSPRFSFYDGPPFANGLPHYGHVVPITLKDAVTRYKTMRGYYVPRRTGWDTHGLPVEYEVEKQLGISGKRQIVEMGVDKFNQACRDSVFKYKSEWELLFRRIGRWADKDNSYATMDNDYIESVWYVFAEINRRKLLYQGFKSMPYCPRCATPLSNFEVNQGYKDDVPDPSVYVLFRLKDDPNTNFLAWTTTPWTLPANAALAVDEKAEYVTVQMNHNGDGWKKGEKLILAKERVGELELRKVEYKIITKQKGHELIGQAYEPLYPVRGATTEEKQKVHRIYADKSVSLADGTGILHVAPRYGETDLELGLREGLPLLESVDASGHMTDVVPSVAGQFFKQADDHIIADLTKKGRIFAAETFTHTYPFCWRCDTPLMYFATPSWFVKVTSLRDKLVANNNNIDWVPQHIKDGRFGNWLAEARDWSISRNRFWGAPIPVWQCDDKHNTVIESIAQLKELVLDPSLVQDLHRPGIDAVTLNCAQCGKPAKRVEEVLDCWFESGSMPYAQDHYPFEHKDEFEQAFPADFIAEALDQTRGWFYTLHVLATALFDQPAFKNVVVNGLVLAADGKKLSKRLRNYPPMGEVFDRYGADVLRYFMMSSPVVAGEDVRFSAEALGDVQRNVFMTIWNVYSFFSTYAEVDKWQPPADLKEPDSDNLLDQWLLTVVNKTIKEVTIQADKYQVAKAVRPLTELIDELSNWYVRRSRRRFWKSQDDADKQQAYATLHYVLVRISQLLAPWAPFVSDRLYRELTEGMDVPSSVHLSDWPKGGKINSALINQMQTVRVAVTEGLARRAEAGIKVRQPLSEVMISTAESLPPQLVELIAEELNVKKVVQRQGEQTQVELNTAMNQELKLEGLARDIIRQIQRRRKEAGLEVDDRIKLNLESEPGSQLAEAIKSQSDLIKAETLALELVDGAPDSTNVPVQIGGEKLVISLKKTSR